MILDISFGFIPLSICDTSRVPRLVEIERTLTGSRHAGAQNYFENVHIISCTVYDNVS